MRKSNTIVLNPKRQPPILGCILLFLVVTAGVMSHFTFKALMNPVPAQEPSPSFVGPDIERTDPILINAKDSPEYQAWENELAALEPQIQEAQWKFEESGRAIQNVSREQLSRIELPDNITSQSIDNAIHQDPYIGSLLRENERLSADLQRLLNKQLEIHEQQLAFLERYRQGYPSSSP